MSYREEEKKIQWKLRRIKAIAFAVIFVITVVLCIFSAFVPPATWKYYFDLPSVSAKKSGELRFHFIDVGQGDCTLIELPDGQTVLVDGGNGEEESTTSIMRYLNALKVDYIDHVVLTHTDSDHCGGLDTIFEHKEIGTVYYPEVEDATINEEFASFYAKISSASSQKFNRRWLKIQSKSSDYQYTLTWLWPFGSDNPLAANYTGNEQSAILYLQYGEKKALLMGDSTERIESRLKDDASIFFLSRGVDIRDVDLLKTSHHGSSGGNSLEFIEYTKPKHAVISCGRNNPYGHPHVETIERLSAYSTIWRTDTQGNVLVTWQQNGEISTKTEF